MRAVRLVLPALLLIAAPARPAELLAPDRPIPQVIDRYVDANLKVTGVTPAAQADDYTLVRRLTPDLVGRIPTPAETRAYVESADPHKRQALVDRLMASPAFVRHQANQFEAMLAGPNGRGGNGLREYLLKALRENRPWDQMFREIVVANEADPNAKGASDFVKSRVVDLDRLTTDVSALFFGVYV